MTTDIGALDPRMIPLVEEMEKRWAEKGLGFVRTSTARTQDEQIALYAQHRGILALVNVLRKKAKMRPLPAAENAWTVTNSDGVDNPSMHQLRRAVDEALKGPLGQPIWPPPEDPRWLELGVVGEEVGLVWGGRWSSPDPAHYELREV
jgi:D-alanyl-D-alanine carboxypeptidase